MAGPVEAVIAEITRPAVAGVPQPGGGVLYRGGLGHQAARETIRVIRSVERPPRAIVALEYDDVNGQHWLHFFGAEEAGGEWRLRGGGGGSGRGPQRSEPWVNFASWGWPRFLALGGRVQGAGVHLVRCTDAHGRVTEDLVEEDVSLLLNNDPVEMPCRIELLDMEGASLGLQEWPPPRVRS